MGCGVSGGDDKVVQASYLRRYCYFVVSRSFAVFLAAAVVGRSWEEPAAVDRRPVRGLELDSPGASACRFGDPSC